MMQQGSCELFCMKNDPFHSVFLPKLRATHQYQCHLHLIDGLGKERKIVRYRLDSSFNANPQRICHSPV